MALSAELEKALGYLPAAEREATRKRLTELEEGGLRQSEFSRKMNELAETEKAREMAHKAHLQWHADNQAFYKQAIAERNAAKQELEAAAARLKDLESNRQPTSNPEQHELDLDDPGAMAKALREARAEAAAAKQAFTDISAKVGKIDEMLQKGELVTREEATRQLNAYSTAVLTVGDYQRKHEQEYGVPVDRGKLLEASEQLGGDLEKAYKFVTEDLRWKKREDQIRAEVLKEQEEKQRSGSLPIASGEAPIIGPLQARVMGTQESKIDPSIRADGSGRLAMEIAKEMRAEGKF